MRRFRVRSRFLQNGPYDPVERPVSLVVAARSGFYLLAMALTSLISLGVLPLITRILRPADFGVYALVSSYVGGLGTVLAAGGLAYVMPSLVPTLDKKQRQRLISTALMLSAGVAIFIGGLIAAVAKIPPVQELLGELVPPKAVPLAIISMVLYAPWIPIADVLTIDGKARAFAYLSVIAALVNAGVLLASLFLLDMGVLSLFAAGIASSVVYLVGGLFAVRSDITPYLDRRWLAPLLKVAVPAFAASLAESLNRVFERSALVASSGLHVLGIYTHSQTYRNLTLQAVTAVGKGVWPETLREAREPDGSFPRLYRLWSPLYIGVAGVGIAFAFWGGHLISVLTNGRFVEAHLLASLWFAWILLAHSGKAATAILFAFGKGVTVTSVNTAGFLFGGGLMLLLVPRFGVAGAFTAVVIQYFVLRMAYVVAARRIRQVPFQDHWSLYGAAIIVLSVVTSRLIEESIGLGVAGTGAFLAALLLPARKSLLAEGRQLLAEVLHRH